MVREAGRGARSGGLQELGRTWRAEGRTSNYRYAKGAALGPLQEVTRRRPSYSVRYSRWCPIAQVQTQHFPAPLTLRCRMPAPCRLGSWRSARTSSAGCRSFGSPAAKRASESGGCKGANSKTETQAHQRRICLAVHRSAPSSTQSVASLAALCAAPRLCLSIRCIRRFVLPLLGSRRRIFSFAGKPSHPTRVCTHWSGLARAGGQPDTDGIANSGSSRAEPSAAFSAPSPQAVFFFPEVAVSDTFLYVYL